MISRFLRFGLGVLFGCFAVLLLGFVWSANSPSSHQYSFEKSQNILDAMRKVAAASEEFYAERKRYPEDHELKRVAADIEFRGRLFDGAAAREIFWIREPSVPCIPASDDANNSVALESHRLCLWRGEWPEAYSIETHEHTLPMSLADYLPPVWSSMAFSALALGFGLASYPLLFRRRSP